MKTHTVEMVIERYDKGRDNWVHLVGNYSESSVAQSDAEIFRVRYPEHRFRAVKITTARQILK